MVTRAQAVALAFTLLATGSYATMTIKTPATTVELNSPADPSQKARLIFESAAQGKEIGPQAEADLEELIQQGALSNPILQRVLTYKAAAALLQARDSLWPFSKVKHARRGLNLLDQAVKDAPEDLQVRFVRLNCSLPLPHFLKDKSKILADLSSMIQLLKKDAGSEDQWLRQASLELLQKPDVKKLLSPEQLQTVEQLVPGPAQQKI